MRGVNWARIGAPMVIKYFVTPDVESSRESQHRHALTAIGAFASFLRGAFSAINTVFSGALNASVLRSQPLLAQRSNSYD